MNANQLLHLARLARIGLGTLSERIPATEMLELWACVKAADDEIKKAQTPSPTPPTE
jgi:hypothetical protein